MISNALRNALFAAAVAIPAAGALAAEAVPAVLEVKTTQSEKKYDIHFANAKVEDILKTLSTQSGETIAPEGAMPNVSVTFNATRMPLPAVLDALTRETETTWTREADGRIVVRAKNPDAAMPSASGERSSAGAVITGVSRAIAPEELAAAVRLVITPEGKVSVDSATGRVDVQDKPEGVKRAKEIMRLVAEAHPDQSATVSQVSKAPAGS